MNTVIKINGLDVEFSEKVPTKLGAYWVLLDWIDCPELVHVFEVKRGVLASRFGILCSVMNGYKWSTSPLVPAVEVEKAWIEAREIDPDEPECLFWNWDDSRAKRVTEGGE